MKWDRKNKKKLQLLIEAKLKKMSPRDLSFEEVIQIRDARPSRTISWYEIGLINRHRCNEYVALQQKLFDNFGIYDGLLGLPKAVKTKNYIILDVFEPGAIKSHKISIPKDIAEKFLVLGIP